MAKEFQALKALVVKVPVGTEDEYIRKVRDMFGLKYAERNGLVHATYTPNDPYWSDLWNMRSIEADRAWDIHHGSGSVLIAILDTGVDYSHEDLAANYVAGGYDWVNNDNDIESMMTPMVRGSKFRPRPIRVVTGAWSQWTVTYHRWPLIPERFVSGSR